MSALNEKFLFIFSRHSSTLNQ